MLLRFPSRLSFVVADPFSFNVSYSCLGWGTSRACESEVSKTIFSSIVDEVFPESREHRKQVPVHIAPRRSKGRKSQHYLRSSVSRTSAVWKCYDSFSEAILERIIVFMMNLFAILVTALSLLQPQCEGFAFATSISRRGTAEAPPRIVTLAASTKLSAHYLTAGKDDESARGPTVRDKLRKITGFSLTAFRATSRAATGISLSAIYASSLAATGLWIRRIMSATLSIFPAWVSCACFYVTPSFFLHPMIHYPLNNLLMVFFRVFHVSFATSCNRFLSSTTPRSLFYGVCLGHPESVPKDDVKVWWRGGNKPLNMPAKQKRTVIGLCTPVVSRCDGVCNMLAHYLKLECPSIFPFDCFGRWWLFWIDCTA